MAPHQPYLFWAFSQVSYNRWTPLWGCFSTTLEKPSGRFSLLSSKCTPSQFFGRHRKHLKTSHYWLSNVLDIGIPPTPDVWLRRSEPTLRALAVDGAALDVIGASNHAVRTLRPNRCSRTSHAAFHVWMTGAFSSIFWVLRSG